MITMVVADEMLTWRAVIAGKNHLTAVFRQRAGVHAQVCEALRSQSRSPRVH